jgi:hypothetical protein
VSTAFARLVCPSNASVGEYKSHGQKSDQAIGFSRGGGWEPRSLGRCESNRRGLVGYLGMSEKGVVRSNGGMWSCDDGLRITLDASGAVQKLVHLSFSFSLRYVVCLVFSGGVAELQEGCCIEGMEAGYIIRSSRLGSVARGDRRALKPTSVKLLSVRYLRAGMCLLRPP